MAWTSLVVCLVLMSHESWARVTKDQQLTINVEDQEVPEDCSSFLDKLEDVIEATSRDFYNLTHGLSRFDQVQVYLPGSWDPSQCQGRGRSLASSGLHWSRPDLNIIAGRSWSGSMDPWTEQPGGCGVQGLRVQLPIEYVKQNLTGKGSKALVREFAKFKFGLFPESGFEDKIYPHLYNEGNVTLINAGCSSSSKNQTQPFCPENQDYNAYAPTKQNLMCGGMSAMQVIRQHQNLAKINRSEVFESPKITFFTPEPRRYSIVLERTSQMDLNGRWTNIKRAMYRFLQHLPVGVEVNIVTFGKKARVNLEPTILTDANREGLHGRIPRKVLSEDLACVYCALNTSLENLASSRSRSGSVILVTGSSRPPQQLAKLLAEIDKGPVRVFPIIYPGTTHPGVLKLAKHGRYYSVPEADQDVTNPLSYLNEALLDILRETEGLKIQKIHESSHHSYEFAGTFTLEENLPHHMTVSLNVDDEDKVEFFEVTDPSGQKQLFSKFEDGMVMLHHPGKAKAGIWTFHAKLYQGSGLPRQKMMVDVVSQSIKASDEPFLLTAFTNVDGQNRVDVFKQPVIIYARLTQGSHLPVVNAKVVARVFGPGDGGPVEVKLRDNGSGDPDLTAHDGIYSGYLTDFAAVPGFYSIQVVADNNQDLARTVADVVTVDTSDHECCGSAVLHRHTVPASAFGRQSAGPGVFLHQGVPPSADLAPPTRVLDFHVSRLVEHSLFIELEWSAPGGDFDKGKASKYEIRCHTSRDAFKDDQSFQELGILVHDSFTPKPVSYGQAQSCQVGIPWPNQVFYYALVAVDEAGNRSPISNVVSVYISEAEATSPASTTPEAREERVVDSPSLSQILFGGSSNQLSRSKELKIFVAVGVVVALLVLITCVTLAITIRARVVKRSEYDSGDKDTYKAYEPTTTVATSKKGMATWLDSLPRSEAANITAHDLSLDQANCSTLNRSRNNNHTLTKTNPYRHKVLTNGSFLNLKDIPCNSSNSSHEDSSRPTTSTEDNQSSSQSSSESGEFQLRQNSLIEAQGRGRAFHPVRRSHTLQLHQQQCDLIGGRRLGVTSSSSSSSHVIDSSPARAIIDTYNGNNYGYRVATRLEEDYSVEVSAVNVILPAPERYGNSEPANDDLHLFRSRTESVV